jgi:hypothetical protein
VIPSEARDLLWVMVRGTAVPSLCFGMTIVTFAPRRRSPSPVSRLGIKNSPEIHLEPFTFFCVFTNDGRNRPSIDAKGENKMFDAKYNQLMDNTLFRLALNSALFVIWVGVAYGTLAVR